MLDQIKLDKVIFIDIETVPLFPSHDLLSEKWKKLWERKSGYIGKEDQSPEDLYDRAGILIIYYVLTMVKNLISLTLLGGY